MPICKVCGSEKVRIGKAKQLACLPCRTIYLRKWYAQNKERCAEVGKRWHERNKEKLRESYIQRTYGITGYQYAAILAGQDNKCCVCQKDIDISGGRYGPVDHCHNTGVIRGILCLLCNSGMGQLNDDPALLRKAAAYLEEREGGITLPLDATQEAQSVDL